MPFCERRELRRVGAHVSTRNSNLLKQRKGGWKAAAGASVVFYVDLYAPLCAMEDEARGYEDELDAMLVGGPPKLSAPLIAQLEAKMVTCFTFFVLCFSSSVGELHA